MPDIYYWASNSKLKSLAFITVVLKDNNTLRRLVFALQVSTLNTSEERKKNTFNVI